MNMTAFAYKSILEFPKEKDGWGVSALNPVLDNLPVYKIPAQNLEKIPTLNRTGFMKAEFDLYSQKFIDYVSNCKKPILEIGAAYGIASRTALEKGATVIANDIDERHLAVLYQLTPEANRDRLYLKPGRCPDDIDLPENSLDAVLFSWVAHFLTGEQIEEAFEKIYKWLAPGGKLFFGVVSPYHKIFKKEFLAIYNERVNRGEEWPGMTNKLREYNPEEAKDLPEFLHVFEEKIMCKILAKYNFKIEKMELFDYVDSNSNGKGNLGFIAVK